MSGDGYPVCSTCGHHTCTYAGACTAFVVCNNGPTDWGARRCGHDCTTDPVVAAWLARVQHEPG